jgi:hypothetical protein
MFYALLLASVLAHHVTATTLATSHFSLSFATKFNLTGTARIVEADLARISTMRSHGESLVEPGKLRRAQSLAVTNNGITYVASVGVGDPATYCEIFRFYYRCYNVINI